MTSAQHPVQDLGGPLRGGAIYGVGDFEKALPDRNHRGPGHNVCVVEYQATLDSSANEETDKTALQNLPRRDCFAVYQNFRRIPVVLERHFHAAHSPPYRDVASTHSTQGTQETPARHMYASGICVGLQEFASIPEFYGLSPVSCCSNFEQFGTSDRILFDFSLNETRNAIGESRVSDSSRKSTLLSRT